MDSEYVDYEWIDNDVVFDDDWMLEIIRDVEDKYFDEDWGLLYYIICFLGFFFIFVLVWYFFINV